MGRKHPEKHSAWVIAGLFVAMVGATQTVSAVEPPHEQNTGGVMLWLKEHHPRTQPLVSQQTGNQTRAKQGRGNQTEQISTGGVMLWLKDWIEGHL